MISLATIPLALINETEHLKTFQCHYSEIHSGKYPHHEFWFRTGRGKAYLRKKMCFGFGLIAKSSIGNLFEILHALHYSAKFMNLVQIYSLQRKLNIFFAEICLSNTISKENFMVCICLKGMLWLQHSVNKASRAVNAMKH